MQIDLNCSSLALLPACLRHPCGRKTVAAAATTTTVAVAET
jgi:hypothetical protein